MSGVGPRSANTAKICPDTPKSAYTSSLMQGLPTMTAFRTAGASNPGALGLVPTIVLSSPRPHGRGRARLVDEYERRWPPPSSSAPPSSEPARYCRRLHPRPRPRLQHARSRLMSSLVFDTHSPRRCTGRAHTPTSTSAPSAISSKGPRVPGILSAWRPSWPSYSISSSLTWPTSGRRTPSSSSSSS